MAIEIQKRSIAGVELRASGDFCLVGTAAAYNVNSSNLGGFIERIKPGAFTRSLNAKADVKCLFNHDSNCILGRVKSGTLVLTDTATGLDFRCQLDKTNQSHRDVYAAVKRGDIDQCSFAFLVKKDIMPDGYVDKVPLRTLVDVDLTDVSVVTYPAYPTGTNAQARAASYTVKQVVKPVPAAISFNERLRRAADAVRADRINMANAEITEGLKDDELRRKMQIAAGTYKGD